jgi:hypothetical protein
MLFKLRMGALAKKMNLRQRLCGLAFDLRQFVQIPIALSYLILPFVLLSGSPLVFWTTRNELRVLIRLASIWSATHWLHNGVMGALAAAGNDFTPYDIRMASYDSEMEQWLSPCTYLNVSKISTRHQTYTSTDYLLAFLRSFVLPTALGGEKAGFKPSGSVSSALSERSLIHRAPLIRRLRVTLFSHLAIIHLLFILACLTGLALNLARTFLPPTNSIPNLWSTAPITTSGERLEFFITRLGWPPLFWLQFVASATTPIVYAIWPPAMPEREELLERDEKTGVSYPKIESRGTKRTRWGWWRYGRGALAMAWTFAVFVGNEVM